MLCLWKCGVLYSLSAAAAFPLLKPQTKCMSQYCSLVNIFDTTTSPFELVSISLKQEEMGNTEQLTTELSDKMAVESSEERYVLCSCNSDMRTNSEKSVLGIFVPNKVLNHHHKDWPDLLIHPV